MLLRNLPIYLQDLYRPKALYISGSSPEQRKEFMDKIQTLTKLHKDYFQNTNVIKGLWQRLQSLPDLPHDLDVDHKFRRHIEGLDLLNGITYAEVIQA